MTDTQFPRRGMDRRQGSGGAAAAAALLCGVACFAVMSKPAAAAKGGVEQKLRTVSQWRSQAMAALSASDLDVVELRLSERVPGDAANAWTVELPLEGVVHRVELQPHSVRSERFAVFVSKGEGGVERQDVRSRTVRGSVAGVPLAVAAGSLLDDGLYAMIDRRDGSAPVWVQPLRSLLPRAPEGLHVVYLGDAIAACEGTCGTHDERLPDILRRHSQPQQGGLRGSGLNRYCAELACDTDVQYFQRHGTVENVVNRIELIVNTVNLQFESELEILHGITAIIVRTAEPDPYTSGDAQVLLSQLRMEWLTNQTHIPYDVVHMFTGRNLIGSTIGIAWTTGALCTNVSFCLSESDWSNTFACVTNVTAHELGHIWGAAHCECPNTTMNPVDMCANTFHPALTIPQIIAYRDSVNCWNYCEELELGSAALPFIDDFAGPSIDPMKWTGVSGAVIVTNAGNAPSPPNALMLATDTEIRSAILNASTAGDGQFKYSWMNRDVGSADAAALQVFYRSVSGQWVMIAEHLAASAPVGIFRHESFTLPFDALSDELRVRFRHITGADRGGNDRGAPVAGFVIDDVHVLTQPIPANNACGSAMLVTAGMTPFSNATALATGPDESCGTFDSDVWFRFINSIAGSLTVSVCDADFDTEVAVYGATCPSVGGTAIACAADGCGSGSYVTFSAGAGVYRIRVSGAVGARGSGTLVIQQHPSGSCPADLNGDGQVSIADVTGMMLLLGPCAGCPQDIVPPPGGDGLISVDDILAVLHGYGVCP